MFVAYARVLVYTTNSLGRPVVMEWRNERKQNIVESFT